jgi:ATP-dependent Clp protease adaptor protein ClpS
MGDHKTEHEHQEGVAVEERLKKPSLYKAVLLNDDYTPMDFVVHILKTFFQKDDSAAYEIMMQVHNNGRGVAGIYPYDVAETKAFQVNGYAKKSHHPLKCVIEKE